jgi:hypothetical protein
MTGCGNRTTCRNLFRQLHILPLKSKCIFLILFAIKNRNLFTANSDSHNIHTRHSDDIHLLLSSLSIFQNGACFTGIKILNKLLIDLKQLVEFPTKFKGTLRRYLVFYCFYSVDVFYSMN